MDPAQDPATSGDAAPIPDAPVPGLREQLGALQDALRRLLVAHLDLARAEASDIGSEISRVAVLAALAIGALLVLGLLIPIGGLLFLGDVLLGSIGWGLLLGGVALLDLALFAVLIGIGLPAGRIGRDFLVAFLAAAVVTILLLMLSVGGRISVGLGLLVLMATWPILAGLSMSRRGLDLDTFKSRFYPAQTIRTTKETITWVRERTPLGRKS